MIIRHLLAIALVVGLVHVAVGAEKKRDWQSGKVVDSHRTTSETSVVYQNFLIEGEAYSYLVQERLLWRWSKAANLTVNGPVKFAIEKRKLILIDEDGKEHDMEIIKKVLREKVEPSKVPQ